MNKIRVYDEVGKEVEKEIVLLLESNEKSYVLFKDIEGNNKKIYASYFFSDESDDDVVNLHNDLSNEEFSMLEKAYEEGRAIYDRKN